MQFRNVTWKGRRGNGDEVDVLFPRWTAVEWAAFERRSGTGACWCCRENVATRVLDRIPNGRWGSTAALAAIHLRAAQLRSPSETLCLNQLHCFNCVCTPGNSHIETHRNWRIDIFFFAIQPRQSSIILIELFHAYADTDSFWLRVDSHRAMTWRDSWFWSQGRISCFLSDCKVRWTKGEFIWQ